MSPVITAVEVLTVPVPFRRSFVIGSGPVGAGNAATEVVFVKLTADDGTVGWGEQRALPTWSYETHTTIAAVIEENLAPLVIGRSPYDIVGFHRAAAAALSPSVSNGFPFARAAVDIALHDLAGKAAGLPVHALLGGRLTDRVPLCSAIGIQPVEQVEAQAVDSQDLHAYKVKISGDPVADEAAIRAVARHSGTKPLWLDANQSYRWSTLRRLLRAVEDVSTLSFVEQPVPSTDWAGLQRIRAATALPVAIDEGSFTASDLARTTMLGGIDAVVVKVCKSGGLRQAQQSVAVAQAHGIEVLASGLTDCGIGFAAALHLFSGVDLALPAELNGPELLAELYVDGLEFTDGCAVVPDRPGLGIDVDEDRLRATAVHRS